MITNTEPSAEQTGCRRQQSLPTFSLPLDRCVVGTIKDANGMRHPSATVQLTSTLKAVTITRETDSSRTYESDDVQSGQYTDIVSAAGIEKSATSPLVVNVGARQRVDLALKLGSTAEIITASGAGSPLETDTSDRGETVQSLEVVNLPLNGHAYAYLATIVSGVRKSLLEVLSLPRRDGATLATNIAGPRPTQPSIFTTALCASRKGKGERHGYLSQPAIRKGPLFRFTKYASCIRRILSSRAATLTLSTMLALSSVLLHAQTLPPTPGQSSSIQSLSHSSTISSAKAAKIDEMLTVTGTKAELSAILSQGKTALRMFAIRKTVVPGESLEKNKVISPKEKELSDGYLAKLNKIADTKFGFENLDAALVRYCADNFTDENIDGIIAFYKSPAGKAMLEKGPALNHVAQDFMEKLRTGLGSETDQITTDYIKKRNVIHPPQIAEPAAMPKSDTHTSANREPQTGADSDRPE